MTAALIAKSRQPNGCDTEQCRNLVRSPIVDMNFSLREEQTGLEAT
jgi:hypothetical protein